MDEVMEIIINLNSLCDQWGIMRDSLQEKFDIIFDAGSHVVQKNGMDWTTLQIAIQNLLDTNSNLGAVYLLSVQSEVPGALGAVFVDQCKTLISQADRKIITFASKDVVKICRKLTVVSSSTGQTKAIIRTLISASIALAPNPTCLTPIHSLSLQACISCQMYTLAANILRKNSILQIDPKATHMTSADYLSFFYYSGICFTAVKNFTLALDNFQQVLSAPAQSLSAVVVASAKKARLVALIHTGTKFQNPSHTSPVVSRFLKQEMAGYDKIVEAFVADDGDGLRVAVGAAEADLRGDANWGLSQQVVEAFTRFRMKRLSSTYVNLSLADVAASTGLASPAEAEAMAVQMIGNGEIEARVDQRNGMMLFNDGVCGSQAGLEQQGLAPQLHRYIGEAIDLSNRLRDLQQVAITSRAYISKAAGTSGESREIARSANF